MTAVPLRQTLQAGPPAELQRLCLPPYELIPYPNPRHSQSGVTIPGPTGTVRRFPFASPLANTNLAPAGVGERVRMEFMRHSDSRLTNKVYIDASQLSTTAAVTSLPSLLNMAEKGCSQTCSQIRSQESVPGGHNESQAVTGRLTGDSLEPLDNGRVSHEKTRTVTVGQGGGNGSGDRARTCNILVNSQTLYH
jgi:hypothetical protein